MRHLLAALALGLALVTNAFASTDRTLSKGWKFIKSDPIQAEQPTLEDSSWINVTLPHTWNVEDGATGKPYYRGPGWYRLHLNVTDDLAKNRLFLRFGAASLIANVYVNGKSVGTHLGGFTAFCFDVTPELRQGDNLLAVRVDNTKTPNLAPLNGDFTVYGGLYREVKLLTRPLLSIAPDEDATSGVHIVPTLDDSRTQATVAVTTRIRNAGPSQTATVETLILDPNGRTVSKSQRDQEVATDSRTSCVQQFDLKNPHLWNGIKDPALYRARVTLKLNGQTKDQVTETFGIRQYSIDPERGLILNGHLYDLHGADLHQGRVSCGWAATRAMQDEDYGLVREMGCTGVRMAHYPHADHEYELCDQKGLIVWAEIPLVNNATDSPEFFESTKQQLRELIEQEGNHPSIFFWSLYNEPAIGKNGDKVWRIVQELKDLSHQLDPTRLTTGAASMGAGTWLNWVMDVTAINRYWGWYGAGVDEWPERLAQQKREAKGRSFGISEYGAGASVKQHEDSPPQPKSGGKWHPEEWQSYAHEQIWPALHDQNWIWCKFIWVMFDFASSGRNEGDHPGVNDKGMVTADRKTRKDAFFYYKANWNPEPMVYITERRYSPRKSGDVTLKVYSNCPSVELIINGHSLGSKTGVSHVFTWKTTLAQGADTVEAIGATDDGQLRDEVAWQAN